MALAFILRFEGGMPTTKTLWAWVRTARSEHSRAIGVRSTSTLFNEASARERARQEAVSRHPGRRGGGGGAHLRRPHLALRRLRSTSIFFRPVVLSSARWARTPSADKDPWERGPGTSAA